MSTQPAQRNGVVVSVYDDDDDEVDKFYAGVNVISSW